MNRQLAFKSSLGFMQTKSFFIVVSLLAFWPSWFWFAKRTLDKSDEPLGILSLLSLVFFVISDKNTSTEQHRLSNLSLIAICILLGSYILSFSLLPNIIQAGIAVLTMLLLIGDKRAGLWGLAMLCLPIVSSMQYYIGYPIRLAVTQLSARLLSLSEIPVYASGINLGLQGHIVAMDEPCSGIKMLWLAIYLSFILATVYKWKIAKTIVLTVYSMVACIVANSVRVSSLFIVESGLIPANIQLSKQIANNKEYLHDSIGTFAFIILCLSILLFAFLLDKQTSKRATEFIAQTRFKYLSNKFSNLLMPYADRLQTIPQRRFILTALTLVAISLTVPLLHEQTSFKNAQRPNEHMVSARELRKILSPNAIAVPLSQSEAKFAESFPGYIAKFQDGDKSIIIRLVVKETRQLHPLADCLRASGYDIHTLPIIVDRAGSKWAQYEAKQDSQHLLVQEQIKDKNGQSFTDVSQWYWTCFWNNSHGPWLAVTIVNHQGM